MTRYAIVTDLDRCIGCMACSVACKMVNNVPVGNFWTKVLRVGPNLSDTPACKGDTAEMYFLPIGCQHCENPECVKVCPTGASHKLEDGTIQIDKSKCIGCQFCAMACPYGVRYLNEEERVVEKCTLCEQKTAQGELPQCVINCGGHARWFGDLDEGIENFVAYDEPKSLKKGLSYEEMCQSRAKLGDFVRPFTEEDVHHLPDVGNGPNFAYILRRAEWRE